MIDIPIYVAIVVIVANMTIISKVLAINNPVSMEYFDLECNNKTVDNNNAGIAKINLCSGSVFQKIIISNNNKTSKYDNKILILNGLIKNNCSYTCELSFFCSTLSIFIHILKHPAH